MRAGRMMRRQNDGILKKIRERHNRRAAPSCLNPPIYSCQTAFTPKGERKCPAPAPQPGFPPPPDGGPCPLSPSARWSPWLRGRPGGGVAAPRTREYAETIGKSGANFRLLIGAGRGICIVALDRLLVLQGMLLFPKGGEERRPADPITPEYDL